jgi:hypothetical protein
MPRPTILTQAALVRVASLVDHGCSALEIASEMGCTLGTLRVWCSQHGISLRRRGRGGRESIAATDRAPRGRRMPPHGSKLLTESIQSVRAQQLVADQQLTFALNSKFSCRK